MQKMIRLLFLSLSLLTLGCSADSFPEQKEATSFFAKNESTLNKIRAELEKHQDIKSITVMGEGFLSFVGVSGPIYNPDMSKYSELNQLLSNFQLRLFRKTDSGLFALIKSVQTENKTIYVGLLAPTSNYEAPICESALLQNPQGKCKFNLSNTWVLAYEWATY